MSSVVIFSDEPGWHGRQLRKALGQRGYESGFVSLTACHFDLATDQPRIAIPGFPLSRLAGVFVRGVPGGTLEQVILRLNVLHALTDLDIPVFNDGRAIERTVDKSLTSFLLKRKQLPTAATWVTESREQAREIAAKCLQKSGSVVLKPLFGSQGIGVVRLNELSEFDAFEPTNAVYYLQEYLRPQGETYRDWRVFVINGQAVAAIQRTSHHWVTNRAQGAECEAIRPDQQLNQLAERAAATLGVDYAGVDLMRDASGNWLVGEVNGIPAWQGLQRASNVAIADQLIEALHQKIVRTSTAVVHRA